MKEHNLRNLVGAMLLCIGSLANAQSIEGTITDAETGDPLIGATIKLVGTESGTISDTNGHFSLIGKTNVINYLAVSYIGYSTESVSVRFRPNEQKQTVDVQMQPTREQLHEVVVSAGRFEQNLNEVTVSMEVLKADGLKAQSPTDIQGALNNLSGVDIVDKQPSIRGGGGWTYSVGSRSQILVDGLSVLNPKTGEVNWNTIPMENIAQIEVIKGASSVLYGSSALNGVINVLTDRPGLKPTTKVSPYIGIYGRYKTPSYNYTRSNDTDIYNRSALGMVGTRQPIYSGLDFSHTRRLLKDESLDFTATANVFKDEGYREQGYNNRVHVSTSLNHHHPMPEGIYMNYGAQVGYLGNQYGDFFIWRSPEQATRPSPVTNMGREENMVEIAPQFSYTNTYTGISHKVRARVNMLFDRLTTPMASADVMQILKNANVNQNLIDHLMADLQNAYHDGVLDVNGLLGGEAMTDLFNIDGFMDVLDMATAFINGKSMPSDELCSAGLYGLTNILGFATPGLTTTDIIDIAGLILNAQNTQTQKPDQCYSAYVDYQFAKQWENGARVTTGATWNEIYNISSITGNHVSDNIAAYLQYDQRFFDRLSVSAGARFEYYRIDNHYSEANMKLGKLRLPFRPVFRAGLNYQAAQATFLRLSAGQGYRNPSITEKYVRKDIGGVGAYPNANLRPESSLNVEFGIKQGVKAGCWHGFVDAAVFYSEYWDMIEFNFGLFDNENYRNLTTTNDAKQIIIDLLQGKEAGIGIGAQFTNVSHARIFGAELAHVGEVEMFRDSKLRYSLSYLFSEPRDVDYKKRNEREADYSGFMMKQSSNDSPYLKYRNKHTVKASLEYNYKWFSVGGNFTWKSKILAVDYLMVDERNKGVDKNGYPQKDLMDYFREILFGREKAADVFNPEAKRQTLAEHWNNINKPYCLLDLHAGFEVCKWLDIQLQVSNVLGTEYSTRPMAIGSPRTYIGKLNFKL